MMPSDGTCPVDECDEPTPWDMAAVIFDEQYFCSPDCAHKHLQEMADVPERVTLHDPQYRVDRSRLVGVGDDSVNMTRETNSRDDAHSAIDEMEEMHRGEFRVSTYVEEAN